MKIEVKTLNAMRLVKLLIAASRWLSKYSDVLNDLNVYPVPDGDTGTNMSMTLQAVENDLIKLNHEVKMDELIELVSESILLGARGNSGTILSQIIQGFLDGMRGHEEANVDVVAKAFDLAREKAYNAVSDPVEGTMLTVIRRVAEEALKYKGDKNDFVLFLIHVKNVAKEAVDDTPNLLPKLKEAGVVDAGGMGIFYILEGFEKSIADPEMLKDLERIIKSQSKRRGKFDKVVINHSTEEILFKYCTEFVIESGEIDLNEYKALLLPLGDSMVCAKTSRKTKTHIHTNNPGVVLEIAGKYGNLNNIKIENMEIQHKNIMLDNKKGKNGDLQVEKYMYSQKRVGDIGYFAIADNLEIGNLFLNNGADGVLIGGQTQNPSVADIEEGIKGIKSDRIIILPNNKNIIGTAKLVGERTTKEITVLETTTMLEGNYVIKNREEKLEKILEEKSRNYSIEITKAVRDTKVGTLEIQKDDYIALINGNITLKSTKLEDLVKEVYKNYVTINSLNILTVIGKGSTEEANIVLRKIKDEKRYQEIVGGQNNYPYYIYIENKDPKMPEIAIVTDSTSDLTQGLIGDLDISIIPLKINLGGDEYYREGVEINKKEFWKYMLTNEGIPKTSQPSPADFRNLYQKLLDKGYKKIISIHISSKLSGTQQAARVARGMLGKENEIAIVDSKSVTFGLGYQALEASRMAKENGTFVDILRWLDDIQSKNKIYFVVNDMKFLEKGGRIGKASAVIGGFLNLKPILKIEDGEVTLSGKAFGEKGAINYLIKKVKEESSKNSVIVETGWGGSAKENEGAEKIRKELLKLNKVETKNRYVIGGTIGSHSGPVMGIDIIPKIL